MDSIAFSTPVSISKSPLSVSNSITSTSTLQPSNRVVSTNTVRASTADIFQWRSQIKEGKEVATSTGVYSVQCAEGTAKSNDADYKRLISLSTHFRLRQASPLTQYADLYATRRAAIIQAEGSHTMEQYAIKFPARASASLGARAESLLACNRYMSELENQNTDAYLMQKCVMNQYSQMKVPNGEYSTLCNDGTTKNQAETTRTAALAVNFKSKHLSTLQKTQMKYNAVQQANRLGFGCSYEESYFVRYPTMAAAMTYGNGSYAAKVVSTSFNTGSAKPLSVSEQIKSVNVESYWPSYLMRPAVEKEKSSVKFWTTAASPIKNYAYMSAAAVEWGMEVQAKKEVVKSYDTWTPGWQPKSCLTSSSN